MNLLSLLSLFFGLLTFRVGEEGGGAEPAAAPAPAEPAAAPAPEAAPAAPAQPASIAEAMFGKETGEAAANLRGTGPRDPAGKFVPKVSGDPVPAPKPAAAAKPAAAPAAPAAAAPAAPAAAAPAAPEPENPDPLAMPAGLTPKAQERFQRLANENRELTEKADTATRQVEYVKTTFHEHGVKPEQFEQAASLIGMLNRGDFRGARAALEKQLQQIALITGEPGGTIDALANFPDLRQAVDGMQMTEAYALEIARARATQHATGQRVQREQEQQQRSQQETQAVNTGTLAVDAFCKRMQGSDPDYAAIEAHLLPEIPNLLRGVPPSHWASTVEAQYRLMKTAATKFRQPAPSAQPGNALRPTGTGSVAAAPRSMLEAMFPS
jgi:hypothetical protein